MARDGLLVYVDVWVPPFGLPEDSSKSSVPTPVTASLNVTLNWSVSLSVVCVEGSYLVMEVTDGAEPVTVTDLYA